MKVLLPLHHFGSTAQGSNTIEEKSPSHILAPPFPDDPSLLRLHPNAVFPWLPQLIHAAYRTVS